jgi:SAM-dependent methyltransferase
MKKSKSSSPRFSKASPGRTTSALGRSAGLSAKSFQADHFPGFSARDLRALEDYYADQLRRHKTPQQRVGWNTEESQRVRFEALASVGKLQGTKILDVGCGLGGFWGYLKDQKIRADYTGVDLFPNVIREAKRAYPGIKFEARNLLAMPFDSQKYDYSFLSGVFNVKVRDNIRYMKAVLNSVLQQTRKAVAFNVLNSEAGIKESNRFMVGPRELVELGRQLEVSRVHLLDHYHHLDLTLFLYK